MRPVMVLIRLRECADFLNLRAAHISKGTLSDIVAHILSDIVAHILSGIVAHILSDIVAHILSEIVAHIMCNKGNK